VQWVKPDILDWDERFVAERLLAPPTGATHIDPVGGLVASTEVALKLHKGLKQQRTIAIAARTDAVEFGIDDVGLKAG